MMNKIICKIFGHNWHEFIGGPSNTKHKECTRCQEHYIQYDGEWVDSGIYHKNRARDNGDIH